MNRAEPLRKTFTVGIPIYITFGGSHNVGKTSDFITCPVDGKKYYRHVHCRQCPDFQRCNVLANHNEKVLEGLNREEQFALRVQRIREDYNYLDEMPTEGWLWEFIRRSPKYKAFIQGLSSFVETLRNQPIRDYRDWDPEMANLILEIAKMGLQVKVTELREWDEDEKADYIMVPFLNDLGDKVCYAYPREYVSYCELIAYTQGGTILDYPSPIKYHPHEILNSMAEGASSEEIDEEPIWKRFLRMLSPTIPEKTLYVGISLETKKEEIMQYLSKILDFYLPPKDKRTREKEWKPYLMVYDLKREIATYRGIADIFRHAYPDEKKFQKLWDEKNIENYWKQARSLIEKRNYLKYFPLSTIKK